MNLKIKEFQVSKVEEGGFYLSSKSIYRDPTEQVFVSFEGYC